MTQKGTHTWDLVVHYHKCPECGYIIESRQDYHYQLGKYIKELECSRCHKHFTVQKPSKPRFGPLLGEPEHPEFDWS
ncbi:MAG: hypothetical protein H0X51_05525 [Parachlamydiaceae bacterium]|nr:hypothetical protein [Parachlamydiaceae bacterium]